MTNGYYNSGETPFGRKVKETIKHNDGRTELKLDCGHSLVFAFTPRFIDHPMPCSKCVNAYIEHYKQEQGQQERAG